MPASRHAPHPGAHAHRRHARLASGGGTSRARCRRSSWRVISGSLDVMHTDGGNMLEHSTASTLQSGALPLGLACLQVLDPLSQSTFTFPALGNVANDCGHPDERTGWVMQDHDVELDRNPRPIL